VLVGVAASKVVTIFISPTQRAIGLGLSEISRPQDAQKSDCRYQCTGRAEPGPVFII
jgi:hypothetical protein